MNVEAKQNTFTIRDLQSWSNAVPLGNRGPMIVALCVLLTVFGFGGYWSATAPLGGAVLASGRVVAQGRNVAVQNLEGGILADIFVVEGQAVRRGDSLAKLDTTSVSSQLRRVHVDRAISTIELNRWRAEQSGLNTPININAAGELAEHPRVREAFHSQVAEAASAREAFLQKLVAFDEEIQNEEEDLSYLASQRDQTQVQIDLVGKERDNLGKLQTKGLVSNSRILSLDRELSRLEAEKSNIISAVAKSHNNIESLEQRKRQAQSERMVNVNERITELQKRLTTYEDQVTRLEDTLERSDLVSPVDGIILTIPAKSLGSVVQPGQTILEILPSDVALEVEAHVRPDDINKVFKGQHAEVVFPSDQKNVRPPLDGEIGYISADALVDVTTGQAQYVTRVDLSADWNGRKILPGMVAEVFFQTESKTLLELLAEPIARFARRTFSD